MAQPPSSQPNEQQQQTARAAPPPPPPSPTENDKFEEVPLIPSHTNANAKRNWKDNMYDVGTYVSDDSDLDDDDDENMRRAIELSKSDMGTPAQPARDSPGADAGGQLPSIKDAPKLQPAIPQRVQPEVLHPVFTEDSEIDSNLHEINRIPMPAEDVYSDESDDYETYAIYTHTVPSAPGMFLYYWHPNKIENEVAGCIEHMSMFAARAAKKPTEGNKDDFMSAEHRDYFLNCALPGFVTILLGRRFMCVFQVTLFFRLLNEEVQKNALELLKQTLGIALDNLAENDKLVNIILILLNRQHSLYSAPASFFLHAREGIPQVFPLVFFLLCFL